MINSAVHFIAHGIRKWYNKKDLKNRFGGYADETDLFRS